MEGWRGEIVLLGYVSTPGGGSSYRSFAAGPCLREEETSLVPPSSVLSPGVEDSHNLASPALGVQFVG